MDKVTISNLQGENGLVNVVRYFNNNGTEILIYTLNEVDADEYTRLYVTKLNGVDGMYNAETLNDNEWNEIKNLIKTIVKANKEGMPVPVQDLNPEKIRNITLKDKKVFKLNTALVNDLTSNKTDFKANNQSAFDAPVQPTFEVPSAPTFNTPVQPTFEVPSAPTFDKPAQPTFEVPSAPAFDAPTQPTFEVPSAPTFDTPVQPTFEVPSTPAFDAPTQPTFEVPSAPTFDTPVQPTFEVPSTPSFDAPTQPTFEVPSAPAFDAPTQPTFEVPSAPTFDTPVQPAFDFDANNNTNTTYVDDYKSKYEEELRKNNELETQLQKYVEMINKMKDMLQ